VAIPNDILLLIQRLSSDVRQGSLTQQQISDATGVDQSQVSRILAGNMRRVSENVEKLCNYAKTLDTPYERDEQSKQDLIKALLQLWDGTPVHAITLKQLLHAIGQTQSTFKTKG